MQNKITCIKTPYDMWNQFESLLASREKKDNIARLLQRHKGNIYIYGCGNVGTTLYKRLKIGGGIDIEFFIDNGNSVYGNCYDGKPVKRLEDTGCLSNALIIVSLLDVKQFQDIKFNIINKLGNDIEVLYFTQLRGYSELFEDNGINYFSAYIGTCPEVLFENKDNINTVYNLLNDNLSKINYMEILRFFIEDDFISFTIFPFEEHYFDFDLYTPIYNEVFVDCGAYDGDTYEIFSNKWNKQYKKYYAVEADEYNIECFKNKTKGLKNIEIIPYYLSSVSNEQILFSCNGQSYARLDLSGCGNSINSIALDDYFAKVHDKPTFIKMNIEGAEMDALHGMKQIISESHPIVAVQGHHKREDFWNIVLLLKSYYDGYNFYLRNYKGIVEYTFYAIPHERGYV